MRRDAVQILLPEITIGMDKFVSSHAARDEHDEYAVIRHQQESKVLNHAAGERWRNENSEPARNGRQYMARSLHHRFGRLCRGKLAANPLAVFGASGSLRRHLLHKKSVCRGGGHAAGGRVRLVEEAFALEIRHHVADRGGAKRLDMARNDAAGGDRLARLDVGAHHIGQNLLMPLLLQDCQARGYL